VPATWMVGGVGDGVSMDWGRVDGASSYRWSRHGSRRCALAATLSRGKKEGGGRDLRAPRAAVRDRRTILTGQSLGKYAISPPVRTFGESTRVRRRRGGAFRPRRRVDILSHCLSSCGGNAPLAARRARAQARGRLRVHVRQQRPQLATGLASREYHVVSRIDRPPPASPPPPARRAPF